MNELTTRLMGLTISRAGVTYEHVLSCVAWAGGHPECPFLPRYLGAIQDTLEDVARVVSSPGGTNPDPGVKVLEEVAFAYSRLLLALGETLPNDLALVWGLPRCGGRAEELAASLSSFGIAFVVSDIRRVVQILNAPTPPDSSPEDFIEDPETIQTQKDIRRILQKTPLEPLIED